MNITLKQKLIGASLLAVMLMACTLTWLAADQLLQQTRNGMYSRAESTAKTAASGISDWITIRKEIASAFNTFSSEQDVVPFLKQARLAGGFDDIF